MGLKIFIHVFGCRSSLCEGEFIAGTLKSYGAEITEELRGEIDGVVIVTCSVTQEADKKCRQLVRRVKKFLGDDGVLAVCGCWSQALDENTAREMGINILAGSKGKNLLPEILREKIIDGDKNFQDLRTQNIFAPSEWEELAINSPVMHSRAFMKIQDGCNHFCTYCIIPYLRGRPVSRPIENILDEIKRLIDNGTKEIIFTGIHLGIYGRDINTSLAELIRAVSKISELKRLRLGSLEPFCLDENLLDALADCEAFCHHLHLPLQSGDDEILASMKRGYKAGEFVNVCYNARKKISDKIHISSDILIGFPGEGDYAFQNTLNIMKSSGLGRVHVFPYSERRGTPAASFPGKIQHDVKISRTSQAIKLGRELYEDYVRKFINSDVEILIESDNKGYTRNYIEAECEGEKNEIVKVKALCYGDGRLKCERRD
ncbi:MAG: MiaB/RimO family radical SAM methylthiotransferase [Synergistaceae bacterium]|nr:MiaB/RimO family radical SAM methylthiotransferase [Synergistaceae bacterium]